jgi:hypothetical protein
MPSCKKRRILSPLCLPISPPGRRQNRLVYRQRSTKVAARARRLLVRIVADEATLGFESSVRMIEGIERTGDGLHVLNGCRKQPLKFGPQLVVFGCSVYVHGIKIASLEARPGVEPG